MLSKDNETMKINEKISAEISTNMVSQASGVA
jgi:hypothetical protein